MSSNTDALFAAFEETETPTKQQVSGSVDERPRKRRRVADGSADGHDAATAAASASPAPPVSRPKEKRSGVAESTEKDTAASSPAAAGAGAEKQTDGVVPIRGDVNEQMTTIRDEDVLEVESHRKPAKEYSFELDPFQKRSVAALERNESVLVSAHTSAGKTVVAEYAIAMALRDKQRVIYTSPIKALSNQKYRDLYEEFGDVGLMTGDVTIAPNSSCLVMTTEILRSMLYRGSEVMREVKWVIFDEIHYMRDAERGVVWEESIILLPHSVRFVFLSATIPNAPEFADWVGSLHHQTCHVVYTEYRPTPLQHFIFPSGGDGVYMVVDEKAKFREDNFNKAMAQLTDSAMEDEVEEAGGKRKRKRSKSKGPPDLYRLIKMIMERNYDPVIVFSFSKRECEAYALQLGRMDFTSDEEKKLVDQVFVNAVQSLSEDDRQLPQIESILPLLRKGIGIHHGGLLPILKEIVEILFQESLVKILFATETFAMGVNMPAKTVIFTASRKFDGKDFRWISAGEYIQMSGRAGRRGLDDRGIVIQMVDQKMEPEVAKDILKGTADPLNSSFHLGYNMLLNLMRVEDMEADPEMIMEKSFHQFQNKQAAPKMEREVEALQTEQEALEIPDETAVREYHALLAQRDRLLENQRTVVNQPRHCLRFLQPGRLARVRDTDGGGEDWGWGVIVNFQRRPGAKVDAKKLKRQGAADAAVHARDAPASDFVVDMLLLCDSAPSGSATKGDDAKPRPCPVEDAATRGNLQVIPVLLPALDGLSKYRMKLPNDLRPEHARDEVKGRFLELQRRFSRSGMAELDPEKDMAIDSDEFRTLKERLDEVNRLLESCAAASWDESVRESRYAQLMRKLEIDDRVTFLRRSIRSTEALVMRDSFKKMRRVLRRLGHIDEHSVVQLKGRVACEVNTADELLVTELVFNGVFNDLTPAQTAALVSCLVNADRGESTVTDLPAELNDPLRRLREAARRVATVTDEARIPIEVDEYVDAFKPDMMELVFAWAKGAKFRDVCAMTKQFEGSVIRVIRRLEELLRQLADACRAIGDTTLEEKFKEASARMRRDIVFAASLYL